MQTDIHPKYHLVVFQDTSSDFAFLTKSTIETSETIEWEDGVTYPLAKVEISSASHPFYTGKQILVDTTGRVERFRKRYGQTATQVLPEADTGADTDTDTGTEADTGADTGAGAGAESDPEA